MTKIIIIIIFTISFVSTFGQIATKKDSTKPTKYFGIYAAFDLAFNFQDKVINHGINRKISSGLSFTNKKKQFALLLGGGFKFIKGNLYSPKLRESFLKDISDNYVSISDTSESQYIGVLMGPRNGKAFSGNTAFYLHCGFILNTKFKPSLNFYYGEENYNLYDQGLTKYEDPKYGDIHYVGMPTKFYEVKLGCTLPLKIITNKPFCLNLNIGYKWVDYMQLKFSDTPLSAYTKGSLADKYRYNNKFIISLSYTMWSN